MSLDRVYRHLWSALTEGEGEVFGGSSPRGPEWIFSMTDDLGLDARTRVLDLGCGPGEQARELRRRYGARIVCVDPLLSHLHSVRAACAAGSAGLAFLPAAGRMERVPLASGSVDLVWLRDALVHSARPDLTAAECQRVLVSGGHLLLHSAYATEKLSSAERQLLIENMLVSEAGLDREVVDRALERSGLRKVREEELGSELAEHYEVAEGAGSRALLRIARVGRSPEEARRRWGDERLAATWGIDHWVVFELLGKLSYRTTLLVA